MTMVDRVSQTLVALLARTLLAADVWAGLRSEVNFIKWSVINLVVGTRRVASPASRSGGN